ncbi:oligopeptidase A [Candidatus Pantoea edessiphila]|uniref:oligopeptidase A n=1 Tax=Candidatus Pantoea edessiphila TaxID=2044610 RepID=A0A2P5SVT0_9GAMM|nr:oligopeptidase A [Candidatus Pantoea edessiphila]PPI86420.1 oligopeptidase A [Candidatus Pantoea edessiphila]
MHNPLLTSFILPPFSKIQFEQIIPAIIEILKDCELTVEKVLSQKNSCEWNNIIQPINESQDLLNRVFSIISHLNSVINTPELRKIYKEACLLITQYNTCLGQNKKLYQLYVSLRKTNNYMLLNNAQKKYLQNILLNFKLSGIKLKQNKQERYLLIVNRLSELEIIFSNNLLDASMGWKKLITNKKELSGVPENILVSVNNTSENEAKEHWTLTLDFPIYSSIITYCNNDLLRKDMYLAYSTRASDKGPVPYKWDNTNIINEQLSLRFELANLLGFKSFANKSLINRMVRNPLKIIYFLEDLLKKVKNTASEELSQLKLFSKKHYNINVLNPWDFAYYSQKQKEHIYTFNDEQLRSYFPKQRVLSGLFKLINIIYGVHILERKNVNLYHPDVNLFDVFNEKGHMVGSFYTDLYARKNKRSGAWMDSCINKMLKKDGNLQNPVAYIVCNFNSPKQNKPALFTHNEVIILFHEFGHCLHHILTSIEIPEISGINGVPLDSIEFPSQFMENWCWEPDVLLLISEHYKTGEQLPNNILKSMLDAKNYQISLFILRQIEFSLFDLNIHYKFHPEKNNNVLEILKSIRSNVSIFPYLDDDRFPHSFNHIFGGCYASGYYSYLWAGVMAADAYARFKEDGIFNKDTGQSFLKNILMLGGSEDFINMFKKFRGREPNTDAFLKQYGI